MGQVKLWQVSLLGIHQVDLSHSSPSQLSSCRNREQIASDPHQIFSAAEGVFSGQPYDNDDDLRKYFIIYLPMKQDSPSLSVTDAKRERILVDERFHPPPEDTVNHTDPDHQRGEVRSWLASTGQ